MPFLQILQRRYQLQNKLGLGTKKFQEKGCLCTPKSPGRPSTSAEMVEQVHEAFQRIPQKSARRASLESHIPQTTVWRILRKRLRFKPYKLQLVQALRKGDKQKRKEICVEMQFVLKT